MTRPFAFRVSDVAYSQKRRLTLRLTHSGLLRAGEALFGDKVNAVVQCFYIKIFMFSLTSTYSLPSFSCLNCVSQG